MQQNRAIIRLDSIRSNARYWREQANEAMLCAVVKADAYGHGATMVAHALQAETDMFAVALVEEGVRLRVAGITKDILVLVPPLRESEVSRACDYGLILSVSDASDYAMIARVCKQNGSVARCHIQVNTGMNRFGFDWPDFDRFCGSKLSDFVAVEGIYSHFYRPDEAQVTQEQYARFCAFALRAEHTFGTLIKHIAATGGVLSSPEYCMDMVRIGIGLYGYVPAGFLRARELRPALSVYASVASVRKYRYGGAGYGERVPRREDLCVIRTGYADGFARGNVLCMDAWIAERACQKYEEVCVFSDADAYASEHGTISYEVLVRVCCRAIREYVDG